MGVFTSSGQRPLHGSLGRQCGAVAIEFALVALFVFLPLLITIMDLGRWFLANNAVSEAARLGARLAVVCSPDSPDNWSSTVLPRMQRLVPGLQAGNVEYKQFPNSSCKPLAENPDDEVCTGVSVTVRDYELEPLSFWLPKLPVLPFKVSLPSENMTSSWEDDGTTINNPVCN